MKNLVKMTRSAYSTARSNRTLVCPNVALITDENNKVEYLKMNPTHDIGIASWEGGVRKFYSLAEWNALETKPTALGVYVFTEDAQFIFTGYPSLSIEYDQFGIPNVGIEGLTTTNDGHTALLDFNGKSNTQAVLDAITQGVLTSSPLFEWVNQQSALPDGSHAYIPSAGEVELIVANRNEINTILAALGLSPVFSNNARHLYTWTSTQVDMTGRAWRCVFGPDGSHSYEMTGFQSQNGYDIYCYPL